MSAETFNVMVIDDDRFILASLQRTLRKARRLHVEYYSDASDALKRAGDSKVDLFICDYQMPLMDGVRFMEHVSILQPSAMRMMLSGSEADEIARTDVDIHRCLTKPVDPDTFIAEIEQLLAPQRTE